MYKEKKPFGKYIFLAVLIIAVFFGYEYFQYQHNINTAVDPSDLAKTSFIIKKGDTLDEISKQLSEKDLILDQGAFKIYTRLSGTDRKIVAGRFILNRAMTVPIIVENLTNRNKSQVVLTIREGKTVSDIDAELTDNGLISPGDFKTAVRNFSQWDKYSFLNEEKQKNLEYPLEGYLFPDTYYLDPVEFYSENLIQMMLNNFKNKMSDEINSTHERDFSDYVIMASILEKEVRTDKDMPIVSGILWKRLDEKWLLGADATLLYLKANNELDYADLNMDSPYNTRKNLGLPPGPISNPGLKTLQAAFNPEESPYYYYLTKPKTGEVVYAKTNDEHNANKRKYL